MRIINILCVFLIFCAYFWYSVRIFNILCVFLIFCAYFCIINQYIRRKRTILFTTWLRVFSQNSFEWTRKDFLFSVIPLYFSYLLILLFSICVNSPPPSHLYKRGRRMGILDSRFFLSFRHINKSSYILYCSVVGKDQGGWLYTSSPPIPLLASWVNGLETYD